MVFKLPIQFGTKSKIPTKNSNCDNNRFFILTSLTIILCTTILSKYSQSQPKPPGKSNLVKIGNCTYSIIGNISAFNDAVKDQKVGNYQDALQKYLRSLNNVYKCNYKSYNNYAICTSMLTNYRQSDSLFRESIKVGKSCDSCIFDDALPYYNRFINKISEGDDIFAFLLLKNITPELIKAHPFPIGYVQLANGKTRDAILTLSLGEKLLQSSFKKLPNAKAVLQFNLAMANYRLGDFKASQKCLDNSTINDKLNFMDWTLKGILAFENSGKNAESYFRKAIADKPSHLTTINLPKYYLLSGQFDKAANEFLRIFQNTKEMSDTACFGLAVSTMLSKKYSTSLDYFNKLYKLKSGRLDSEQLLAKATMYLNNKKLDNAETLFNEIIAKDIANKNYALIGLAVIDYYREKYTDAITKFNKAEKESGQQIYSYCTATIRNMCYENLQLPFTPIYVDDNFSKDIDKSYYVLRLLSKGYSQCFNNNIVSAYELVNEAYGISKNDPQVLLLKGFTEYLLGKFDDAVNSLDDLLKIDPTLIDAYKIKALALNGKHNFTTALKILDKALLADTHKQDQVYNIIGLTYSRWLAEPELSNSERDSLTQTAIAFYERAYSLKPEPGYQFNIATQFADNKDSINAKKHFTQHHTWSWMWNNSAIMKNKLGDFRGAQEDINKALALEKIFPSMANENIMSNSISISNHANENLISIYCYNLFPDFKVEPVEITRPFSLDAPPLKKFDPEFEMYETF